MPPCPYCHATTVVKNGSVRSGKQKYACKACGRQFVENPQQRLISDETRALVDKLLLERIPLAGIVRVTGVSLRWLQYYVNDTYAEQPQQAQIPTPKKSD